MPTIANGTGLQVRTAINAEFDSLRKDASAATPAAAGWYRIASSALNIGRNRAIIELDWTGNGIRGSAEFVATCHEGAAGSVKIQELAYSVYDAAHPGLTKARIVYHTTPTGNYAYVEVYLSEATATTINVRLGNPVGWTAIVPNTDGEVPAGYTSLEWAFTGGVSAPAACLGFFYFVGETPTDGTAISITNSSTGSGAWQTVGPTGSGADIIWTALDSLPAGVRGLRLYAWAKSNHLTGPEGTNATALYLRKYGSSAGASRPVVLATTMATGEINDDTNMVDIPIDSNKMFELYWSKSVVVDGYTSIDISIEGYYL